MSILDLTTEQLTGFLAGLGPFVKFENGMTEAQLAPLSPPDFKLLMNDRKHLLMSEEDQALLLAIKPDVAAAVGARFVELIALSKANNEKREQLRLYRKAVTRLAEYPLAEGREGQIIEEPVEGQWDADGSPVVNRTVIEAIPPLVAEDTEYPVLDAEGVPTGETVTEPNREVQALLDQDAAARAAAQAVVDATPQEVKDFDAG